MSDELQEEWRRIPGYPDYEVSNLGRVRSWKVNAAQPDPPRMMSQVASPDGYRYVFLYASGKKSMKRKRIHTLVLEAFVGPRPDGQECRHLDADRGNNCLSNLAWGDRLAQWDDRRRQGRDPHGEQHRSHKLTEDDVRAIRRRALTASARSLAREYGVSHTTINAAIHGPRWAHVVG